MIKEQKKAIVTSYVQVVFLYLCFFLLVRSFKNVKIYKLNFLVTKMNMI